MKFISSLSVKSCLSLIILYLFAASPAFTQPLRLMMNEQHTAGPLRQMQFSPDGKYVLSSAFDGIIKLWDVHEGRLVRSFVGLNDFFISFTADFENDILLGSAGDVRQLIVWRLSSGEEIFKSGKFNFEAVAQLSGRELIGLSREDSGYVVLRADYLSGKVFWKTQIGGYDKNTDEEVYFRLFTAGENVIVTSSYSNSTGYSSLVDAASGRLISKLPPGMEYPAYDEASKTVVFSRNDSIYSHRVESRKTTYLTSGRQAQITGNLLITRSDEIIEQHGAPRSYSRLQSYTYPQIAKTQDVSLPAKGPSFFEVQNKHGILAYSHGVSPVTFRTTAFDTKTLFGDDRFFLNYLSLSEDEDKILITGNRYPGSGKCLVFNMRLNTVQTVAAFPANALRKSYLLDDSTLVSISSDSVFITNKRRRQAIAAEVLNNSREGSFAGGNTYYLNIRTLLKSADIKEDNGYPIFFSEDDDSLFVFNEQEFSFLYDLKQQRIRDSIQTGQSTPLLLNDDLLLCKRDSVDHPTLCYPVLEIYDLHTTRKIANYQAHVQYIQSVAANKRFIATGSSDHSIWIYDLQRKNKLKLPGVHEGSVVTLRFIKNGSILVSAGVDNRVVFWSTSNWVELATLHFLDEDNFAVTTPSGLFDATPKTMESLYYVKGFEIIQLEQLKDRFFEPGLLQKLVGYSSDPLRSTNGLQAIGLYPSIDMVHPAKNNGKLLLKIKDQGGGIGPVRIWINNKEVINDARQGTLSPTSKELAIEYPVAGHPFLSSSHVNTIMVKAYNKHGDLSSRGKKVYYVEEKTGQVTESPTLYGVIIGASDYEGTALDLRYAAKDAEDFAFALNLAGERLFRKDQVNIKLLTTNGSEKPTRDNIINAFARLKEVTKPKDVVVVYLAGHGMNHGGAEGDFYFLTCNAGTVNIEDPAVLQTVGVSSNDFTDLMKSLPALKQVLILDACHSGKLADDLMVRRDASPSSEIRALERMKDRAGVFILAGSAADAVSYEATAYGQGLLTYSLLSGMHGNALREQKYLDVMQLFQYASDKVPELASSVGGMQKPQIRIPLSAESFDIGLLTEAERTRIRVPSKKPVFIRSNFTDEESFDDGLNLSGLIDDKIRSSNSNAAFFDVSRYDGGYSLKGRYTTSGSGLTVTTKIFKGTSLMATFKTTGKTADELSAAIITHVLQQVPEL